MRKRHLRIGVLLGGLVCPPQSLAGQHERPFDDCRWGADRTVVIGAVDDQQYGLTAIGQVASLSDLVYVTQPQERLIRVYHDDGRFAGTIGGNGDGPGEFRAIRAIGVLADSIWVVDSRLGRVSYFNSDLHFTSSVTIHSHPSTASRTIIPMGPLSDGSIIGYPTLYAEELEDRDTILTALLRFDRLGQFVDTLVVYEDQHNQRLITDGLAPGLQTYARPPIREQSLRTIVPGGAGLVIVHRPFSSNPAAARYEVVRIGSLGDTLFARQFSYVPRPVTDTHITAWIEEEDFDDQPYVVDHRAYIGELRRVYEIPPHFAPVTQVLGDTNGRTWIRRGARDGMIEWHALDDDGQVVDRICPPPALRLLSIDTQGGWFAETDQFDIPYLVRYEF